MRQIRSFFCALLPLLLLAGTAVAQRPDAAAGAAMTGTIRPLRQLGLVLEPRHAAEREVVTTNLRKLLDIVQRNPALAPPKGLDVAPSLVARTPLFGMNRGVIQYELTELIYWYTFVDAGRLKPQPASMVAFYLRGNQIRAALNGGEPWPYDTAKQTYLEPRQIGEAGGYPYYDSGGLVVKKTDRPIWVPLTREQALGMLLGPAKTALAQTPQARPDLVRMAQQDVSCLEAALAALSPAERASAAYVSRQLPPRRGQCSPLVPESAPGAQRLVRENPEFYDRKLPPSALQVIILDFEMLRDGGGAYPWQKAVVERLRQQMDYPALAALLPGR